MRCVTQSERIRRIGGNLFTDRDFDLGFFDWENGLARIYGTRMPLPSGRDSRTYFATLRGLEQQAKSAGLGGWRKTCAAVSKRRCTISTLAGRLRARRFQRPTDAERF
jgi:hypothetical protein